MPERDRPARDRHRQARRVVDLEPRLRQPAGVAQGVRDPQLVADVALELADRVAGLEVGQPEPGQDIAAADDEEGQVEEVEQERQAGRERGDDQDDGEDEELDPADHRRGGPAAPVSAARLARRPPRAGGRDRSRPADARPDRLDRQRLEQLADDLAGLDVVDRRARLDDQPVGQGGLGEDLDVVGDDVVPADEPGQRLARPVQGDRAARRCPEVDVGVVPGAVDEPDDVVADRRRRRRPRGRPPASRAAPRDRRPRRARRADGSASARRGSRSPRSAAGSPAGSGA